MEKHQNLEVEMLTVGPFAENCYLLRDSSSGEGIVIDPGDEAARIAAAIETMNLSPKAIVNTHAHIDHVGAVAELKRCFTLPFQLSSMELPVLAALPMAAQMFGLSNVEMPEVDGDVVEGNTVNVGGLAGKIIHTPGHSPGGMCFYFETEKVVIAGDTLFSGSIGRSDLPGGDGPTLLNSIHDRLLILDDDVVVYPGHGPRTTIGRERQSNPFLQR